MQALEAASSSRKAVSMAGSGAMSHVYIQYPPFRCNTPGASQMMYDDGNRLLLLPSPGKVSAWPIGRQVLAESPGVTAIDDGPILAARFSLNGKILAVQRSDNEISYFNSENGSKFRQPCRTRTEQILGFFWTDCPTCDIVYVTSSGLELHSLSAGMNALKLVDVKLSNVSWYVYTHESRLVLLASGVQCKTFLGFQFSAGGIIRLPKFDVSITKAELHKKPVLAPEDVHIATMYGRLYCLQVDRLAMELNIYRFYRDAVVPQGRLPIYSENVAISIVDGVLLVHQIASKVVLLYDILSDIKTPISAPLPLLLRGVSGSYISGSQCHEAFPPGSISNELGGVTSSENIIYGDDWAFANPDIILDHAHGLLWRLHLDLEAIAASSSDIPSLLAFLQRRRLDAAKAKQLCISVLHSAIAEKRPLPLIADAMDVIASAYSHSIKASPSSAKQVTSKHPQSAAVERPNNGPSVLGVGSSTSRLGVGSTQQVLEESPKTEEDQASISIGSLVHGQSGTEGASQEVQDDATSTEDAGKSHMHIEAQSASSRSPEKSLHHNVARMQKTMETDAVKSTVPIISVISPEEMHFDVFANIDEEMSVDSAFLEATIIQYMRSAATEKLKVPPGLHALVVQLLARDDRYAELSHFVRSKIVEPSRELGLQLLEVGKSQPSIHRLGMEMLKHVAAHADYISLLLQQGRLLEGLRHARQNRVEAVPPSTFLESAAATKNAEKLASVLRFCLDFVPNFEQTSEYSAYFTVLKSITVTVAG